MQGLAVMPQWLAGAGGCPTLPRAHTRLLHTTHYLLAYSDQSDGTDC